MAPWLAGIEAIQTKACGSARQRGHLQLSRGCGGDDAERHITAAAQHNELIYTGHGPQLKGRAALQAEQAPPVGSCNLDELPSQLLPEQARSITPLQNSHKLRTRLAVEVEHCACSRRAAVLYGRDSFQAASI